MEVHNFSVRVDQLRHKPLFTLAQLVSPQEIMSAIQGGEHQRELEEFAKSWLLQGDCSRRMVEQLKDRGLTEVAGQLDYVEGADWLGFAVLTQQIETYQHRFVLPLWDQKVAGLIRDMQVGNYRFALTAEGTEDTVVIPGMKMGPLEGYQPDFGKPLTAKQKGLIKRVFPSLLGVVAELNGVDSLIPGHTVEDVSVSVLMDEISRDAGAADTTLH